MYCKKLIAAVYFALFTQIRIAFSGLKVIKLKIAHYSILVLLKPECESRYENFLSNKGNSFIKCIGNHFIKILSRLSSYKSIYCAKAKLYIDESQNVDKKNFVKSLSNLFISSYELKLLLGRKTLEKITFIGLEWYIYANAQIKYLYTNLCLVKKDQLLFFLCSYSVTNRVFKHFAEFLSIVSINLKNIQCTVYKYVKNFMHLLDIECIAENNCIYSLKPSVHSIKQLTRSIKQKLYHKNKKGCWRSSDYISSSKAMLHIEKILSLWRIYYFDIVSKHEALKINRITDHVFYKWQTK